MLWTLVVLPALVGATLGLGGRRADRVAGPASISTAAVVLALAVAVAVRRPEVAVPFVLGTPFALAVDTLSAVVLVTVAAVTVLVLAFALGDVRASPARFHGLMLVFVAAVALTATATTLPTLLVAWEIMGATSYALVGFAWRRPGNAEAGAVAFLTTRTGDLGLYVAAGAALAGGAGLGLAQLSEASTGWRHVIAAGVLVAALGKAAQLPFSFWLSRAMAGPSPVSALLHSAAMVAMGGYLLLRTTDLLAVTGWAATTAAWVGATTALVLGVVAVAQRDLKQLLAASTSAQLGFVVLAAGVGAVAGGTAHLVAHAATKALLFLVAGAWLSALGTKQLASLRGAGRRWPTVGIAAGLGALTLAGIAPLSLWATKDQVLAAALKESLALYVTGLAAAALSAVYAGKIVVVVWRRPSPDAEAGYDEEQVGSRHVGLAERGPLVLLAGAAAVLGLLAMPPIGDRLRAALGDTTTPTAAAWELVLSAGLALTVLAAVAWTVSGRWRAPQPRWAAQWLGLEQAAHALVVAPTMALARVLARFDDRVLDRAIDSSATATSALARRLGHLDIHGVDGVVEGVARATRRAGQLARRPQTGQLHEYYAQATAILAVGVLLLIVVR